MYTMHGINYTGHCSVPQANFPGVLGFMEKFTKRDFYYVAEFLIALLLQKAGWFCS